MARTLEAIEADLDYCSIAMAQGNPSDKNWDWLIRRRNDKV